MAIKDGSQKNRWKGKEKERGGQSDRQIIRLPSISATVTKDPFAANESAIGFLALK